MSERVEIQAYERAQLRLALSLMALVLTAVGLSGCQQVVKVDRQVLIAAESGTATQIRRVAVVPFAVQRGDADIAPEVESMLASVVVNGKPYFTVVERSRIQQVITEMRITEKALFDQATAVRLGKLVGAEGIYTGTVTRNEVADRNYQANRFRCVRFEQKRDKRGNTVEGKCLQNQDYQVSCTERTANISFLPKLIKVDTGTITFSQPIEGNASAAHCQGDSGGLPDRSQMLAEVRAASLESLKRQVAPTMQNIAVAFITSSDGVAPGNARTRHEGALQFVKAGRHERACDLWNEALSQDAKAVPLLHNVGACHEMGGRLDQALQMYDQAERASNKPEKMVIESHKRVLTLIQNRAKLGRPGG